MVYLLRFILLIAICCWTTVLTTAATTGYFQQNVRYVITVQLDDRNHFLRGDEQITYTNNSPDTLREIYFHLWPNAYKNENTVLAKTYYNDMDQRFIKAGKNGYGFVDSLAFSVNGQLLSWQTLRDTEDVALLQLRQPLLPGDSIVISTPFRVKIPSASISRFGHSGNMYMITQWYPKPAVYDRDGWKYMPYIDKGEFYSEFGSFDVTLTLPENYVVGATGELVDGEKETEWLNTKVLETMSITEFQKDSLRFPPSSPVNKTLRYRQDRVHDFSWFADKRWHVMKNTMELPNSRERVTLWAFFTNHDANYWMKATDYMERAIRDYSRWLGDYPYKSATAVDVIYAAGSDMEYPMITAIGDVPNAYQLDGVLAHELGHNWFYGILGSDERRHPWQDEGMNSFYEKRYLFTNYANDSTTMNEYFNRMGRWGKWTGNTRADLRLKQYYRYLGDARLNNDQALSNRSEDYTLRNYSDMVYGKTSLGFQYLYNYLGDSLFDVAMQSYYETWKFKHPHPTDLKNALEKSTGKSLDWFFDQWLGTTEKLDYAVTDLNTSPVAFDVTLKNCGEINGPVSIARLTNDGKQENYWVDGFDNDTTVHISGQPVLPHLIDPGQWMPERNRKNNSISSDEGLFTKVEPLQFRWLTDMEDPDRTQLYVAPAIGWNYYNSVMSGAVIHNIGYPQKKFEFAAMPLFAAGTKDLAGGGFATYRIHPSGGAFQEIAVHSSVQRYAYADDLYENPTIDLVYNNTLHYFRNENKLSFTFRNETPRDHRTNRLDLRHIFIQRDIPYFYNYKATVQDYTYFQLQYTAEKAHRWNGRKDQLTMTGNQDFYRFTASGTRRIPYSNPTKGLEINGRASIVNIDDRIAPDVDYRLRLSGWSGSDDYLFDGVFLGRTEQSGILSQQFMSTDGGFSTNGSFYRLADSYMISMSIKSDLPGKLPVRLYANLATFNDAKNTAINATALSYEGGIEISLLRNIFTLYIPLVYSSDLRYVIDREDLSFGELIRFEIDFKQLNPLTSLNK
jgi:hypothetical protein